MIRDRREQLRLKGSDLSRDLTLPEGMDARLGEEEMVAPAAVLTPRENRRESSAVGMKNPKKKGKDYLYKKGNLSNFNSGAA